MSSSIKILEEERPAEFTRQRVGFMGMNIWNLYARVYDYLPRYVKQYQRLLADVISAVERDTALGGKVLDSGCGTGSLSLALGLRGYDVEGIDISPAMLQRARLKKEKAGLDRVKFREWDIERGLAIYPDATFDCVVSVHALYTLREPEAAIREYLRVLKPSGHFILAEPRSPVKIIPIIKEIYREGGLVDVVKVVMTQSGVAIFNFLISKRLRNGTYHYWDEESLRGILRSGRFRMNEVTPAYAAGLDLLATTVKPQHYLEMNGYRFLIADAREDVEKAHRLRYDVYCLEMELLTKNQGGFEHDEYDEHSTNILAVDKNDRAVGTLRCVHNSPIGFPMDKDFPLTDYMKAHDISRALEIGRFAIPQYIERDARATVVWGLFNCLYGYCCATGIYDLFAVTHPRIIENYRMPGVEIIGKPFRYSKPLTGGLWVPLHINVVEAYQSFSRSVQIPARVA